MIFVLKTKNIVIAESSSRKMEDRKSSIQY